MNLEKTFAAILTLETAGIVGSYAVGGAVAASFYLETLSTLDVDIFVTLPFSSSQFLISLEPLFSHFRNLGYEPDGEYILIEGWPVQFLPAPSALEEEALEKAVDREIDGFSMRVFDAEYLAAIALKTGRAKDKTRVLQFLESNLLDQERLEEIILRHQLQSAWEKFQNQFLQ